MTVLTPDVSGTPYTEAEMAGMDLQYCDDCGAPAPSFPEHGVEVFEDSDDGWQQLCADCSDGGYSVWDDTGKIYG